MISFNNQELVDALWVHKYRPKTLDDVRLENDQRIFFQKCLKKGEIPHTLLVGPPGSGKTTTALILRNELILDKDDCLTLNGSLNRGIGVVRDTIEPFLKTPPFKSKLKMVFIDEFDYMTNEAQESLRGIFEKYQTNARFLCTGNYASKIEPALISRFQHFEMKSIPEEFVIDYAESILKRENVEYQQTDVELIVKMLIPDVRSIINTIQQNVDEGKLKGINKDKLITLDKKLCSLVCLICDSIGNSDQVQVINSKIPELENSFGDGEPDYHSVYATLFKSNIPAWAKITVNEYANKHKDCAVPQCHFMAMVFKMIQNGKAYLKAFGKN